MAGITFHYCWSWALRSDVASLWTYVSDTDRFRAVTNFPAAEFTEEVLPGGGTRRVARFRVYGFPIAWEEKPFEWIRFREFSERHRYTIGPLADLHVHVRLESRADQGTDLTYEVWARPSNLLGYVGIPVRIGVLSRRWFGRAYHQIDAYVQAQASQPFQTPRTPISAGGRVRLRDISAQLTEAGHDPALVSRLVEHVRTAPDDQLTRMRPYALADSWHIDRYDTLALFLRATKLGLLDLTWDMLCPACRGAKQRSPTLSGVTHAAHCPSCNIDFEVDFTRSVEATFHVNPAIRTVVRKEYCIGSPQNTPHIMLQQVLAPHESRSLKVILEARHYRWRVPTLEDSGVTPQTVHTPLDPPDIRALLRTSTEVRVQESTLTVAEDGIHVEPGEIGAGVVTIRLCNSTDREQIVLLEQTAWSDLASTAAEITSLQSFRDLFSDEALRPGESIGVGSMTFLFTDLKGSTALYRAVGDALAFRRVMDHFTILRDSVTRRHGALVKTLGDSIMAVFHDPADAVAAARDILEGMRVYNQEQVSQPLVLKMGIHQGACIAVTLNERLDYFGSVVNLAARLEGQSQGDDVILSDAVASDPTVAAFLATSTVRLESFNANLRGIGESVTLSRMSLVPEAAR